MAKPKRTAHQREKDLAEMSLLEAEGWTQRALAAKFGVSQQQIQYDLDLLDKRFLAEQVQNTGRRKRRRHLEYEAIKQKARAGFDRSCQDAETLHAETTTGRVAASGEPLPDHKKTTKTVKGQVGDPAFLAAEQRATEAQVKLWGDDAPVKVSPTSPDGTEPYGADSRTGALLDAVLRAAAEAAAAGGTGRAAALDSAPARNVPGVGTVGPDAGAAREGP